MDNFKEFFFGAAYIACVAGLTYVTLVVVGNAVGVGQ